MTADNVQATCTPHTLRGAAGHHDRGAAIATLPHSTARSPRVRTQPERLARGRRAELLPRRRLRLMTAEALHEERGQEAEQGRQAA